MCRIRRSACLILARLRNGMIVEQQYKRGFSAIVLTVVSYLMGEIRVPARGDREMSVGMLSTLYSYSLILFICLRK